MEEIGDKRTVPVFSVIASVAIIATLVAATVFTDGAASCMLIGVASEGALTGAVNLRISGAMDFKANPSKYCFVAGTLVLSTVGLVAIEELQPGDMVYAIEAVGEEQCVDVDSDIDRKTILQTYVHETDETYVVTIDGEEIETTAEHPFYNAKGEQVTAKELQEGDSVTTADGDTATVDAVTCIHHDEPVKVYNIAVCDDHTYFVGETHVLVHNACQPNLTSASEVGNGSADINGKLIDGSSMKTDEVLDLASDFLGDGYTEPINGSGRFVSGDGMRVFRMGENDILGKHGGGPHVNFEFLRPNISRPGKMEIFRNVHIFLGD